VFWTHISDIVVGTYSDLFEQWESILPEIQKKILAIHRDSIDAINGHDWEAPAATRWDLETVINVVDI